MGRSTGQRSPGFITTVLGVINEFYGDVVQEITPWQAPAPKLTRSTVPAATEDEREEVRDDPQVFSWPVLERAKGGVGGWHDRYSESCLTDIHRLGGWIRSSRAELSMQPRMAMVAMTFGVLAPFRTYSSLEGGQDLADILDSE